MTQSEYKKQQKRINALIQMRAKNEVLKVLLSEIFEQIMEKERKEFLLSQKSEEEKRSNYRNGYYYRKQKTLAGTIKVGIPRTRKKAFPLDVFDHYKENEEKVLRILEEISVNGVYGKLVEKLVDLLYSKNDPGELVQSISKGLNIYFDLWQQKNNKIINLPVLLLNTVSEQNQEGGEAYGKKCYVAVALNVSAETELIRFMVLPDNEENPWDTFFKALKKWKFKGIKLVLGPDDPNIKEALAETFRKAEFRPYLNHFMQKILKEIPIVNTKNFRDELQGIINYKNIEYARVAKDKFMEKYSRSKCFKKYAEIVEEGFERDFPYIKAILELVKV